MKQKKELSIFCILIGLSLFLCYPFLKSYINIMDDMPFHLNRIVSLADNLKAGELLPTIYGNSIAGYGYANGLFYPDLFIYIPAIFMCMGLNLIQSYGLFILLITIATSITTFVSVKSIINIKKGHEIINDNEIFTYSEKVSLLTTIVYLAFPYRLIDIYIRGALGEILVFIFIPIVIWGLYEIFHKEDGSWKVLTVGMVGLVYSHIITLFLMAIIVLIFTLFNHKKIKGIIKKLSKATIFSILISSMFLLPMLEQILSNEYYFNVHKPLGEIYENSFNFFDINNQFLLVVLNVLILSALVYLCKKVKNEDNKTVLISLLLGIYLCLMTTNLFPWEVINKFFPIISYIQFPWRLFMLVGGLFGIANAIKILDIFEKMSFKVPLLITLFISMAITYFCINPIIQLDESSKSYNYLPMTEEVGKGEYFPSNFSINYIYEKKITVNDINEKKLNYEYEKSVNKATLKFNSKDNNLDLELPIIYYKGYKAYINNNELKLYESDKGLVTVNTEQFNEGIIYIEYEHTLIQIISYIITLISLVVFSIPLDRYKRKLNKKN